MPDPTTHILAEVQWPRERTIIGDQRQHFPISPAINLTHSVENIEVGDNWQVKTLLTNHWEPLSDPNPNAMQYPYDLGMIVADGECLAEFFFASNGLNPGITDRGRLVIFLQPNIPFYFNRFLSGAGAATMRPVEKINVMRNGASGEGSAWVSVYLFGDQ